MLPFEISASNVARPHGRSVGALFGDQPSVSNGAPCLLTSVSLMNAGPPSVKPSRRNCPVTFVTVPLLSAWFPKTWRQSTRTCSLLGPVPPPPHPLGTLKLIVPLAPRGALF